MGTVIEGDAARPSVLRQARLDRTDVVAALTDDESANFATCRAARRIADVRTLLRVTSDPDERYEEFVDGIGFPESYGARVAANGIVGGGVRTVEEVFGDVEIVEVEIAEDAPVEGKRLAEVRFPRGIPIIVDTDGERIGGPETDLLAGHRYPVAVRADVAGEVTNFLRG